MPEERHLPNQSSPSQHTFIQETRRTPSPQQQREASPSAPSAKTLPQSLIPHLPFWEQPSFQNAVLSTNKLPLAQHQQREDFSLSSQQKSAIPSSKTSIFPQAYHSQELQIQLQEALSSYNPPQKRQSLLSQDQTKPSSPSPQQIRHTQASFPQPKQLRPLPSSKYIHPSPFDEIVQKYSSQKQMGIGKNGTSLSSEEELELIHQQEQEIERKWGATSDPNEKARLEAQVATLWKRSKEIQFGAGWQPGGPVQPHGDSGSPVLKGPGVGLGQVADNLAGVISTDAFSQIISYLFRLGYTATEIDYIMDAITKLEDLMGEKSVLWSLIKWSRERLIYLRFTLKSLRRILLRATDPETIAIIEEDIEEFLEESRILLEQTPELERQLIQNHREHKRENSQRRILLERIKILLGLRGKGTYKKEIDDIINRINRILRTNGEEQLLKQPRSIH